MPEWDACAGCKRSFDVGETAHLRADFHLLCSVCNRSRTVQSVDALQRDIFARAQKLSPADFALFAADQSPSVIEVSGILKRIISTVTGKEVATEKSFAVNF